MGSHHLVNSGDGALTEASDDPGRHESEEQRDDRNLIEILQELRVASIGVQVLFGFLLSLPFSARFARLDPSQRQLYIVTVLLTVLSIAELSAPVAYHRLVFRQHKKARLVRTASTLALCGLATVALSLSGAVLFVATVVLHGEWIVLVALCPVVFFIGLWVVLPLGHRSAAGPTVPSEPDNGARAMDPGRARPMVG